MGNKKPSKNSKDKIQSPTRRIFFRTQLIALISYLLSFGIISIICLSLDINKNSLFYVAMLTFALSSFICAYYAGFKIHQNGLITGLLYALPANLFVIAASVIIIGFKIDFTVLISLFILLISSMLAGILSVNTKLKPKRK